jgi:hypothetical protein
MFSPTSSSSSIICGYLRGVFTSLDLLLTWKQWSGSSANELQGSGLQLPDNRGGMESAEKMEFGSGSFLIRFIHKTRGQCYIREIAATFALWASLLTTYRAGGHEYGAAQISTSLAIYLLLCI